MIVSTEQLFRNLIYTPTDAPDSGKIVSNILLQEYAACAV